MVQKRSFSKKKYPALCAGAGGGWTQLYVGRTRGGVLWRLVGGMKGVRRKGGWLDPPPWRWGRNTLSNALLNALLPCLLPLTAHNAEPGGRNAQVLVVFQTSRGIRGKCLHSVRGGVNAGQLLHNIPPSQPPPQTTAPHHIGCSSAVDIKGPGGASHLEEVESSGLHNNTHSGHDPPPQPSFGA